MRRAGGSADEPMTRRIDLNADIGESFGPWRLADDSAIMGCVSSVNIACGGHAGDPNSIVATVEEAHARGLGIGAHPGYDDKIGFGRRVIAMSTAEIERMIAYQIGGLAACAALVGVRVDHIKAHGALANLAARDPDVAGAVVRAVHAVAPDAWLLAIAGTEIERVGERAGLRVAREVFADRGYDEDGYLLAREREGALIGDPEVVADRVLAMLNAGGLITQSGKLMRTPIDSICIHSDTPGALPIAQSVRAALSAASYDVRPFTYEDAP
jgi:5-oxoprolinase (ATP-hydrolysing) subunit A